MSKEQYERWTRVLALLLQIIGLAGIVFVIVFGAITGNFQLGLLPFCGTFAGGGALLGVVSNNQGGGPSDPTSKA